MTVHQLLVIGFDEIVANKYLPVIREAMRDGFVGSYSVIDLESERQSVEARLTSADPRPRKCVYVPSGRREDLLAQETVRSALAGAQLRGVPTMAYIATEVSAHEAYLRRCVSDGVDSLVEKPVLAPMVSDQFEPSRISATMAELITAARHSEARHSVMTLSRYHRIYNDKLIGSLRKKMIDWETPLTSFHLRAAGGVWNLEHEYVTRDDHPYRWGYGMLMHGAYHYIDLAVQILALNKLILPSSHLRLQVASFGAYPDDQGHRVSARATAMIGGDAPCPTFTRQRRRFGETDITSVFRLVDADRGATITLGTLAFEQTTPSIRSWSAFPAGVYNKNGRTSSVDLEAQLSTLYSMHVHCYDVPEGPDADKIGATAEVVTRANASLMPGEEYVAHESFDGLFHSDSNRALMHAWLRGAETRSLLGDHYLTMRVTEALALSLRLPGQTVEVDGF